jgi:hypothetical protein
MGDKRKRAVSGMKVSRALPGIVLKRRAKPDLQYSEFL